MSDSLWPYVLQCAGHPCPLLSPGVCSRSCPLAQWCYLIISSSVSTFSFYLLSFPASGSFPKIWLFSSGGQGIGVSTLPSVLPMSIQGWFPLELTCLISLLSKRLSRALSRTTIWKHQFLRPQVSSWSNSPFVHDYCKNHNYDNMYLCWLKWCLCFFNTLSKLVMVSLPRSKRLLISWLQSVCSDFGAQENKICHCFHFSPFYLPWSDGTGCHDLSFLNVEF